MLKLLGVLSHWSITKRNSIVFHTDRFVFSGKPQEEYQLDDYGDDYDYEGDEGDERQAETAITDQVNFTNQGRTITVDKGTTISLPCYVDEFPSKSFLFF